MPTASICLDRVALKVGDYPQSSSGSGDFLRKFPCPHPCPSPGGRGVLNPALRLPRETGLGDEGKS